MTSDTAVLYESGKGSASTKEIASHLREAFIEGKTVSADGLKPIIATKLRVNKPKTDEQEEIQIVMAVRKRGSKSGVVEKISSNGQSSWGLAERLIIGINEINVSNRMRQADPATVRELAKSINVCGLIHPIVLDKYFNLIAGFNRLEACKMLGMTEIPFTMLFTESELHRQLAEIDENLVRANLTQLEEALQIARRKEIYETIYPETTKAAKDKAKIENANKSISAPEDSSCPNDNLSSGAKTVDTFAKDTASKASISERTVQRKAALGAVAKSLSKETADSIIALQRRDKKLKLKPIQIRRIAETSSEEQMEIVAKMGQSKTVAAASKTTSNKKALADAIRISNKKAKEERAIVDRVINEWRHDQKVAYSRKFLKKPAYLTHESLADTDTGKYCVFKVAYLASGAIRITISPKDAESFETWVKSNNAELHFKPVELFKKM